MNYSLQESATWESDLRRETVRLAVWSGTYIVTMAAAVFGSILIWPESEWLTVAAIGLNLTVGVILILRTIRHVSNLDEMMQRIQVEATALAFGVGVIGGLTYSVLDITNVISWDAEIGFLVISMCVVYLIGIASGLSRTR